MSRTGAFRLTVVVPAKTVEVRAEIRREGKRVAAASLQPLVVSARGGGRYLIRFTGSGDYLFHRVNETQTFGGNIFRVTFDQSTEDYGWKTSFQPLAIATPVGATHTADGTDALTGGNVTTERKITGAVEPDSDVKCEAISSPEDVGGNPPQATVAEDGPNAGQFTLQLESANVPQYDGQCDDGSQPKLAPIDTDEDSSFVDDPFGVFLVLTYKQLASVTSATPLSLAVKSPDQRFGFDCSNPAMSLVACESNLGWKGTVTISKAP